MPFLLYFSFSTAPVSVWIVFTQEPSGLLLLLWAGINLFSVILCITLARLLSSLHLIPFPSPLPLIPISSPHYYPPSSLIDTPSALHPHLNLTPTPQKGLPTLPLAPPHHTTSPHPTLFHTLALVISQHSHDTIIFSSHCILHTYTFSNTHAHTHNHFTIILGSLILYNSPFFQSLLPNLLFFPASRRHWLLNPQALFILSLFIFSVKVA